MELKTSVQGMYEKARTTQFVTLLQKTRSQAEVMARLVGPCSGEMYQIPTIGNTEIEERTQRFEKIVSSELAYGHRNIRPRFFKKFLKLSSDDEKLLEKLPITTTEFTKELGHATERIKDFVAMGTCPDKDTNSPTYGQVIIQRPDSISDDAVDGSPYNGGTTGGLFGDNYIGKFGVEKCPLPQMPYLMGQGLATQYDDYTGEADTPLDTAKTNVIPANFVANGTPVYSGMTIDKMIHAIRCMEDRFALSEGGQICLAITPRQKAELMRDEKMQNADYGFQVLKNGMMNDFLGVRFIIINTLPIINVGTVSNPHYVRACPMWRKDDLAYSVWEGARFRINTPSEWIDMITCGVTFGMGAARTREESFISIHCDENFKVKNA